MQRRLPCRFARAGSRRPVSVPLASLALIALGAAACGRGADGAAVQAGSGAQGGKTPAVSSGTTPEPTSPTPATNPPFEPLAPRSYASKVKDLLTGHALSDDELAAVTADPKALRGLVDRWMATDEFRNKLFAWFKNAFQQTQIEVADFDDQLPQLQSLPVTEKRRYLQTFEESFARTMLAKVAQGRPLTEAVTTTTFMMNVPLMFALAYMDAAPKDDLGNDYAKGYWLLDKYKGFKVVQVPWVDGSGQAVTIPLSQSLDPASPNFMRFVGDGSKLTDPNEIAKCAAERTAMGPYAMALAFQMMNGHRLTTCAMAPSVFGEDDWKAWRMVTVRKPRPGEERTIFWEIGKLRDPNTTELVLETPRIGFMTTPAFFANWPTNTSNSWRVTLNQALIVALGRSFDDRATTIQLAEESADTLHAQPGTGCFACHQTLDPMRDFLRQSYTLTYSARLASDPKNPIPALGTFSVDGSAPVTGNGIEVLAKAMAAHPRFAAAWTQKLCQLANASDCDEGDPEFVRVAEVFRASGFDLKALVRELFSSPLVTYAVSTKTAETEGVVMSIARRDVFCARLSNRLGLDDVCNLAPENAFARTGASMRNLSLSIPGPSYTRADEKPLLPHDPNTFFTAATERICAHVATQVIDTSLRSKLALWRPADADRALPQFVSRVIGLPAGDARGEKLLAVLKRHHQAALDAKEAPLEALRSTFVLACTAPPAVSSGL